MSIKLGGIVIEPDDPSYLEALMDPREETLDINALDAAELLAAHKRRQASFDTGALDPPGHFLRYFPGGYTVRSGSPGAGKTSMWRQDVCMWLRKGHRVFVCSLEETAAETFLQLAMTALGTGDPSADSLQYAIDVWQKRLFILSMKAIRTAELAHILAISRILAKNGGLNHVVIDPYTRLDIGAQDWERQRQSANDLVAAAGVTRAHIHVICHPRKPMDAGAEPTLYEVGGAGDLTKLADNVVFTMRAPATDANGDYCPARLLVCKQREASGWNGSIIGHWIRTMRQFHPTIESATAPTRYLPSGAYGDMAIRADDRW